MERAAADHGDPAVSSDSRTGFSNKGGKRVSENGSDVVITALENGPYLVSGAARVSDPDGGAWDTEGRATFALCRCGASRNKPFCDGTHSAIGFAAAERAVEEADGS